MAFARRFLGDLVDFEVWVTDKGPVLVQTVEGETKEEVFEVPGVSNINGLIWGLVEVTKEDAELD
jgi:hypothetical protein